MNYRHFKIIVFTLGVCSVYWISEFPPSGYILITLISVGLVASKYRPFWILFAFIAGVFWLVLNAEKVSDNWLPPELENQNVLVSGRIIDIPKKSQSYTYGKKQQSHRFTFYVDCAQSLPKKQAKNYQTYLDQALKNDQWAEEHCNPNFKKVLLQWYGSQQKIRPGQNWLMVIRAKRPHGYANPGGFDYEKWLFHKEISATAYVKNKAPKQLLSSALDNTHASSIFSDPGKALSGFKSQISYYRWKISEKIILEFENKAYAALVSALVVGDKRYIGDEQNQILQRTGTSHLLAVSGLHIGLFSGLVYFIVSIFLKRAQLVQVYSSTRKIAMLAALLAAFVYSALAGFSTPTIRALIMLTTFSWYLILDRQGSVWDAFFWALFWVLILTPLSILSLGFWLSFIAVFSILMVVTGRVSQSEIQKADNKKVQVSQNTNFNGSTDPLSRNNKRLNNYFMTAKFNLARWGWLQWTVFIGLLPLSVLFFGQISLIAPFVNLLIIPVFAWSIVPLSLLGGLTILFIPKIAGLVLMVVEKLLGIIWPMLEWVSNQTLAIKLIEIGEHKIIFVSLIVGALLFLLPKGFSFRGLALLFMLPLLAAFIPTQNVSLLSSDSAYQKLFNSNQLEKGEFDFSVLDVGQGLSAILKTANHVLVYDVGYKSSKLSAGDAVIVPYLKSKGIQQVDLLLLSHDDNDHTGGFEALVEGMKIKNLASPEKVINTLNQKNIMPESISVKREICSSGKTWEWDGVFFYAMSLDSGRTTKRVARKNAAPKANQLKDNDQSCILKVWNENISLLLPGDLEKKGEKRLLDRSNNNLLRPVLNGNAWLESDDVQINLRADILVAPHHGSKSSTSFAFLEAVSPSQVIFAVGYLNRFGHPHPLIKDRYEKIHAKAFNTALTGAVEYEFRNENNVIHPKLYRYENGHVWNPIK